MARKTATPGEEPTPESSAQEAGSEPAEATAKPAVKVAPAPVVKLLDESEIDPATIPYGQTKLSKQGHVCSTAPDPKRK